MLKGVSAGKKKLKEKTLNEKPEAVPEKKWHGKVAVTVHDTDLCKINQPVLVCLKNISEGTTSVDYDHKYKNYILKGSSQVFKVGSEAYALITFKHEVADQGVPAVKSVTSDDYVNLLAKNQVGSTLFSHEKLVGKCVENLFSKHIKK